jgi:cytochrome P450
LVSKPFSRREVYGYEDGIRDLARSVVLEASEVSDRFDYTELIAKQLPMRMFGRMLGVPDSDGDWLVKQGDALLGNLDPEMTEYAVGFTDTDQFKHIPFRSPAALELYEYAERQAEQRRECPTKDLISALLSPTIDGECLTDLQYKNLFVLMISAGNDTSRYTMAAGLKAFAERPAVFHELRQACIDGNDDVVDRAVEEVLRWGSVTMHFRRTATQDVELGGKLIKTGRQGAHLVRLGRLRRAPLHRPVHVSTSTAGPTTTSPSTCAAHTCASARNWPAWRSSCCSRNCCRASRRCSSTARSNGCAATSSAA